MSSRHDCAAILDDFRQQGRLDATHCVRIFTQLCIEAPPDKRMNPDVWFDVHFSEIMPKRIDSLRRDGARGLELEIYTVAMNDALRSEMRRRGFAGELERIRANTTVLMVR